MDNLNFDVLKVALLNFNNAVYIFLVYYILVAHAVGSNMFKIDLHVKSKLESNLQNDDKANKKLDWYDIGTSKIQ